MILGTLAANLPLLRKALTGNGVTRAGNDSIRAGEDTIREGQDF